jgi:hypothetical protein
MSEDEERIKLKASPKLIEVAEKMEIENWSNHFKKSLIFYFFVS